MPHHPTGDAQADGVADPSRTAQFVASMSDSEVAFTAIDLAELLEKEGEFRPLLAKVARELRLSVERGEFAYCRDLLVQAGPR